MIHVCDAIMGTGKSTAAINYMNEHPDDKFLYITPRLEETKRIRNACPRLQFRLPDKSGGDHTKRGHTSLLIQDGYNVATTHQAFRGYTPQMLQTIRDMGYTLIMDESVDVLQTSDLTPDDWQILILSGYIEDHDGIYRITDKEYGGGVFYHELNTMRSQDLVRMSSKKTSDVFYWSISPELMSAFKDVYILTYLFEGQSIHHFLEMYSLPYEQIGIHRDSGTFRFGEYPGYIPEYTHNLSEMIHILDHEKMNRIGEKKGDLSKSWFDRSDDERLDQLRKNIGNYFGNINRDTPSKYRMWSTFEKYRSRLSDKGYTNKHVAFNTKATNDYRDRTCLAYAINIYMPVPTKLYYQTNGIKVDEDIYALSNMVQWIWRSAIRDGKPIDLYLPSSRMREILNNWIKQLSE